MRFRYTPSDRVLRILAYVIVVGVLAVIALLVAVVIDLSEKLDKAASNDRESRADRAQLHEAVAAQTQALEKANGRLVGAGKKPVPAPIDAEDLVGPAGPVGERGPAPTRAQVLAAVQTYCGGGRCDGRGPTPAQVSSAVAAYCSGNRCRGETGRAGEDGADGASIKGDTGATGARGPAGPGPTDPQIARAVSDYCAGGRCRGETGAKGDTGPAGTARPGSYSCGEGEYLRGFTVAADGSVALACATPPLIPGQG